MRHRLTTVAMGYSVARGKRRRAARGGACLMSQSGSGSLWCVSVFGCVR